VEISIPPGKQKSTNPDDAEKAERDLEELTKKACSKLADTPASAAYEATCKHLTEEQQRWPNTHWLAEELFVPRMLTTVVLNQNGLDIRVSSTDCGQALPGPNQPIPCLSPITVYTYEQDDRGNTHQLNVPFRVHRGEYHQQNGVSIMYDSWDRQSGDLLKKKHVFAHDLQMREPPRLSVCNRGYSPSPITNSQIQEITKMLPESIGLIIDEEQQLNEQTGTASGQEQVTALTPWKTHKYILHRTDSTIYSFCMDTFYVQ
jgi:hypothetical protein